MIKTFIKSIRHTHISGNSSTPAQLVRRVSRVSCVEMSACNGSYGSIARMLAFFALYTNVSCQLVVSPVDMGSAFGGEGGSDFPPQTTPSKVYPDVSERRERSGWRDLFVTTFKPHDCCKHTSMSTAPRDVRRLTTAYLLGEVAGTKRFESSSAYHEFDGQTSIEINAPTSNGVKTADQAMVEVTISTDLVSFENTERHSVGSRMNGFDDNSTMETTLVAVQETWAIVLDRCRLALTFIGWLANKVTFVTLVKNGRMFSPGICLLLKHQALLDSCASGMGTILLLQPRLWKTGRYGFDIVLCYAWHSQGVYWTMITLAVWNLVAIAVERYVAVCQPYKYKHFQETPIRVMLVSMYVVTIISKIPSFMQVRFEDGLCVNEYLIRGKIGEDLYYAYSIATLFVLYLLPAFAFLFLYGRIIASLRRRKTMTSVGSSNVLKTVQSAITKSAFIVMAVFMVTIGFAAWAYTLGYTGVVNYEFGSPVQKIGVFLAVCNSVINPFVYLVFMPPFRDSLRKTLCCQSNTEEAASISLATITEPTSVNYV